MSYLLFLLALTLSFCDLHEARHQKEKLPSGVVVGAVFCDTCHHNKFSDASFFIPGAVVAVECKNGDHSKPRFRQEAQTDERGEFRVDLPHSVTIHGKTIEECFVRLIRSSDAYCGVAAAATSSSLRLKYKQKGTHVFSAGVFTFKPLKRPDYCSRKPRISNSFDEMKDVDLPPALDNPGLPAPIQNPAVPNVPRIYENLPPLPLLPGLPPLPKLPPLPPLPGFPRYPPENKPATVSQP